MPNASSSVPAPSIPFATGAAPAATAAAVSELRVGSTPAWNVRDSPGARLHSVEASTTLTSPSMEDGPGVDEANGSRLPVR